MICRAEVAGNASWVTQEFKTFPAQEILGVNASHSVILSVNIELPQKLQS